MNKLFNERIAEFKEGIEKDQIQLQMGFEGGLAYALQEKLEAMSIINEQQKEIQQLKEKLTHVAESLIVLTKDRYNPVINEFCDTLMQRLNIQETKENNDK